MTQSYLFNFRGLTEMTTYYCIKDTKEVIGTHKDWLSLRDNDPDRYKELNNTRKVELVRVGYWMRDSNAKIVSYGLWDKHKELCLAYMNKEIEGTREERSSLMDDIQLSGSLSSYALGLLRDRKDQLDEQLAESLEAIEKGSLWLPSDRENNY